MTTILWWHWLILGLGLISIELVIPSFFALWFGASAIIVAIMTLSFPSVTYPWQFLIWIISSVILIWCWFKVFKRGQFKSKIGITGTELIGEIGLVTKHIEPFQNGEVRLQKPVLGDDQWEAISDDAIAIGERVRVAQVEGNIVRVVKTLS